MNDLYWCLDCPDMTNCFESTYSEYCSEPINCTNSVHYMKSSYFQLKPVTNCPSYSWFLHASHSIDYSCHYCHSFYSRYTCYLPASDQYFSDNYCLRPLNPTRTGKLFYTLNLTLFEETMYK